MYYKLNESLNLKVIGRYPQAEEALFNVDVSDPRLSRNIAFKKVENVESIITVTPVLHKKAKLTDFMQGSVTGSGVQLMLSNKLKKILCKEAHQGLQFFPMSIINKGEEIRDYWLASPFQFDYDCIDTTKSIFTLYDVFDYTFKENLVVSDNKELVKMFAEFKPPKMLIIDKLFMKDCSKKILLVKGVRGGVGYYVSEKLKQEIEEAGCTGIVFTKPEDRYP